MTLVREAPPSEGVSPSPTVATGAKPSSAIGSHFASLDGYRGIALVFMLLYHTDVSWARGGFFSLSMFFTLSGFLITSMLLRANAKGGIGTRVFWARRFRRLVPAAMLGLVMVVIFGATVATREQAADLPGSVFAASTYWVNWFFIITHQSYVDLFAAPSPLQHYWSLSVEEQFYLLMPIGMILFLRYKPSVHAQLLAFGGAAVVSTMWSAYLLESGASIDRLYYGTDTRVAEILVGGFLGVLFYHHGFAFSARVRKTLGAIGLIMFAAIVWANMFVSIIDPNVYRGGFLLFAVVSSIAIASMVVGGPLAPLMAFAPLAALGRISYGVYIFHWPLFLWLTPERTGLSIWPLFVLRVSLSIFLAVLSYQLIEMPVRNGVSFGLRSAVRWSLIPLATIVIVGASVVTVDRDADDPLATLRAQDSTLVPPVQPADGVLDLLVIPGRADDPVIARMEELAAPEDDIALTVAPEFRCDALTTAGGGQTCTNWLEQWPPLIEELDPDVVLLAIDDWPVEELNRLSGLAGPQLPDFAGQLLDRGIDVLGAKGANVVFAPSGAGYRIALQRATQPLYIAMGQLESGRTNLRHVIGTRLPDPEKVSEQEFLDTSAAALISDADLYQRSGAARLPKIMVVGDSQARSLGFGLERWGPSSDEAIVWNVSTEGCGVAPDGQVHDAVGRATKISSTCSRAIAAWPRQVETFRPDVVIVLSSLWDTNTRKLDEWDDFAKLGDAPLDDYLRATYTTAIDTLSSTGGHVVWMTAPCIQPPSQGAAGGASDLARETIDHLNQEVIEPVVRQNSGKASLFDLDAELCPDGKYRESVPGVERVRGDGVHFTVEGAMWFAETYGEQLIRMGGR